jgi:hypothetical protein
MAKKLKKTITITGDIWETVIKQADFLGMSASSYISMCIVSYQQQVKALEQLVNLQDTIAQLKELKNEIKK